MAVKKLEITIVVAVMLLSISSVSDAQVFDVTQFGAKGDGRLDIDQALMSAWKLACASTIPSKIVIPEGIFALGEVKIRGPCKAPVEIQLQGTLKAPADPGRFKTDGWVTFEYIDQFTISGGGVFNGQGQTAWKQNDCHKNKNCKKIPTNLRFNFITNAVIRDVTTLDSKNFHVNLLGCKNFTFLDFTVTAPADSPNTDGIHIGRSEGVYITDTKIGTGDDCISLVGGSKQVHVTGVMCGPGHGISVGSLGKYPDEEPVSGVWINNCTLTNTDNGVRIKTWPASYPGSASDMHFEDINMVNVGKPVLIDQGYCPWNQCKADVPSLVKISNVSFSKIRGSSSTAVAVKLACSSKLPCEDVVVGDIDLKYIGNEQELHRNVLILFPRFWAHRHLKFVHNNKSGHTDTSNIVPSFFGHTAPSIVWED